MKKLITVCAVFGLVLAAARNANADMIMYADHVTNIFRGDTTIGDFAGFYGGTYPGTYPVELTVDEARAAVLGSPDGSFLSLPGKDDTSSGGFPYAYVEVAFQDNFYATQIDLYLTELGASQESAQLWIRALDGSSIQPWIQRNGEDTITVDLSPFASFMNNHGGAFDRVGIGGRDLLGASQGFDLDAVGVIVPVPSAVLLGILGLGAVGVKLRKHA